MEDVDDFQCSGRAGRMKDQVSGQVAASKDGAARDIRETNARGDGALAVPC